MLTKQRPAGCGTQAGSILGASIAAAAVFTCWFLAQMGPLGLIAFPIALLLILPVAIIPAAVVYRLAVQVKLANDWTAAAAGLLAGEAILFVGDVRLLAPTPFPSDALLFGAAGIAGGIAFWRGVRSETNAPDEPVSPPAPS
jgi:hypothetical protein